MTVDCTCFGPCIWIKQAAQWKADGHAAAAARGLERIVGLEPKNSRAWFGLGQTLLGMGLCRQAEHAYTECLTLETDPVVLARAWQGSGLAAHQDGDADTALHALGMSYDIASGETVAQRMTMVSPITPGEPLVFTSGRLRRFSEWSREMTSAGSDTVMSTVAGRSLLARASILQGRGDLEGALEAVKKAGQYGADVKSMLSALRDKMATTI